MDYGQDVTDEFSAFATEERAVHGGLLEVDLSTEPIFIEEILS